MSWENRCFPSLGLLQPASQPASKKVSKPTIIAVHPLRPILTHNPVPFYSKVIKPDKTPNHLVCFPFSLQNTARKDCVPSESETIDLTVMEVQKSKHVTMKANSCGWGNVHTSSCNTTISFDIVCTAHRNQLYKQTDKMHFPYVFILQFLYKSTCFEGQLRSSSGVHDLLYSAALLEQP